jgi:hypothetical protein
MGNMKNCFQSQMGCTENLWTNRAFCQHNEAVTGVEHGDSCL